MVSCKLCAWQQLTPYNELDEVWGRCLSKFGLVRVSEKYVEALPDSRLCNLPYRYAMKTLEKSEMLERNKVGRVLTEEGILNQGQQRSCVGTSITMHRRVLKPACQCF